MTQMHGRKLFIGFLNLKKDAPVFHIAPVYEIEHPFRMSKKSLYVRFYKTFSFVVGLWRRTSVSETDLLMEALQGRELDGILNALSGTTGKAGNNCRYIE